MPLVSCYLDSPRQTVDFPRLIDGAQGQYMCGETLLCIFSLFLAVLPFSLIKYSTTGLVYLQKC